MPFVQEKNFNIMFEPLNFKTFSNGVSCGLPGLHVVFNARIPNKDGF